MDAITILRDDHRAVDDLFKKFEALGERAKKSKRAIVDKIVRELSIHAAIEEQLLYPVVRERLPDKDEMALEALEEHLLVKIELSALQRMSPDHERYDAKVTVLAEVVRHHVKEEEKEMFPALRQVLSRTELRDLGEALQVAKKSAPTRPHPLSPDEPPGNVVVGAAAALVDRALDTGKHAVSRVRSQAR
jgi:hemerythrin superfamily protein